MLCITLLNLMDFVNVKNIFKVFKLTEKNRGFYWGKFNLAPQNFGNLKSVFSLKDICYFSAYV